MGGVFTLVKIKKITRITVLVFLVIIFLISCNYSTANYTGSSIDEEDTSESIVPDWLYQSLLEKFENTTFLLEKEHITFAQVNLKQSEIPQIAAYVTIDRLNGYFAIYEYVENEYIEVFSKSEPIYGMQVFGGGKEQLIGFTSGLGGTGVQENNFHLIGYTNNGYSEVWSGIAEKYEFWGEPPYYSTIGSYNLSMGNKSLFYSKNIQTYNNFEVDPNNPDSSQQYYELLIYDDQLGRFVIDGKNTVN